MKASDENRLVATGTCSRAAEALSYAQEELADGERRDYDAHLAGCAACRSAVGDSRRLLGRLKSDPDDACPPGLTGRIMDRLSASGGEVRPVARFPLIRPAILARAAAVILAAGVGAWLLLRNPGPRATDSSVAAAGGMPGRAGALEWLRQSQKPDGGWSAGRTGGLENYDVGVTGLALLALMGEGSESLSGPFEGVIRKGLDHLVSLQAADGLLGPSFSGGTYNQGLGALALLEGCARDNRAAWREAAARAVRHLLANQDESGGWNYLGGQPGTVNTSASIWPLVALIRAQELGIGDSSRSIERGLAWLRSAINPDGLMGYHRANEAPAGYSTLTAAGAMCLLKSKGPADRRVVSTMLPAIRRAAADPDQRVDFYRMFFVSEALTLARDESADRVRRSLDSRLAALQMRDGQSAGSWPAVDQWGPVGGPVYATSLAAMSIR